MEYALESCIRTNVKRGVIPLGEMEKRDFKLSKRNYVPTICGTREPWAWGKCVVNRAYELMTRRRSIVAQRIKSIVEVGQN